MSRSPGTPTLKQDVGYMVYWGTTSGVYDQQSDANDQTSQTILHLTVGTQYYFAVTAYNQDGMESDYSEEISCTIPRLARLPPPRPTPTATPTPPTPTPTHARPPRNANSDSHSNANPDSHSNTNSDPHSNANPDLHSNANPDPPSAHTSILAQHFHSCPGARRRQCDDRWLHHRGRLPTKMSSSVLSGRRSLTWASNTLSRIRRWRCMTPMALIGPTKR